MASTTATLKWQEILNGQARGATATYWTGQARGTGMRHSISVMIAGAPDGQHLVIHTADMESKPMSAEILSHSVHDSAASAEAAIQAGLNVAMVALIVKHNAGCAMPGCGNPSGLWVWDVGMWA